MMKAAALGLQKSLQNLKAHHFETVNSWKDLKTWKLIIKSERSRQNTKLKLLELIHLKFKMLKRYFFNHFNQLLDV